jgi:uncharacterized membrane protein YczE
MRYFTSKYVRALYLLLTFGFIGGAIDILLLRLSGLGFLSLGNPLFESLTTVIFIGTPLTIIGSFIFGLIALLFEEDKLAKRMIALGIFLAFMIGWGITYIALFQTYPQPSSRAPIGD